VKKSAAVLQPFLHPDSEATFMNARENTGTVQASGHDTAQQPVSGNEAQEKLWDLIDGIRFCMFTTVEDDGMPLSRPMTTQEKRGDGVLNFLTWADGDLPDAIRSHPMVNLAYSDPDDSKYVSISGIASLRNDVEKKRELWNPMVQAWFPNGPEDPNVVVVEVHAQHAAYWDSNSSKMVQLFKMARAAVTGKQPTDIGESGKLDLR
jgi:general stress protein 26